jgi:hypothetical protein
MFWVDIEHPNYLVPYLLACMQGLAQKAHLLQKQNQNIQIEEESL